MKYIRGSDLLTRSKKGIGHYCVRRKNIYSIVFHKYFPVRMKFSSQTSFLDLSLV
jgi:hypothetical protein